MKNTEILLFQVSCRNDIGIKMSYVETIGCNALKIENGKETKRT